MATMTLTAGLPSLRPSHCDGQSNCHNPAHPWQMAILYISLGFIAIGAGGIRPCNISFGADQFDTATEKGKQQLASFCNWYFFLFTVAIIFVLTGVTYVQTNVSWFFGFLIPTFCFIFSIAVFLLGRHTYILVKPQGSIFLDMVKVIVAAFRKRSTINVGKPPFYDPIVSDEIKLARTSRLRFFDKAAMIVDPSEVDNNGKSKNSWRLCTVQNVEQLKSMLTIVPVLITVVGCFIPMSQPGTFGILQAIQMNRTIGKKGFQIPPAWVKLTIMLTLSIWVFFYEKIYIPVMEKRRKKNNVRLTVTQRLNIGIILSIICMVVAGIVEKKRRESALKHGSFEAPMSVFYLMLPFALAGLVEAFAAVTLMEHLTTRWPERMRTVAGGIFFLSLSVSSYLNSIIVGVINKVTATNGRSPWLSGDNFNKTRLDYYYYVIGGVGVLNLVYFHVSAKHYLGGSQLVDDSELAESKDSEEGLAMKAIV